MRKHNTKSRRGKATALGTSHLLLNSALEQQPPSRRGRKLKDALRDAWAERELAPKNRKPSYKLLAARYSVFPPKLREALSRMNVDEILLAKQIIRDIWKEKYPTVVLWNLAERMKKGIQRLHKQAENRFSIHRRSSSR